MFEYLVAAADHLNLVRQQAPLVHNITNFVVMHTTANALLSVGASPVMAHAPEEVEEIAALASSLVLNIGTLSTTWVASMHLALELANSRDIPVVLDPVGAGASRMRTEYALSLLEKLQGGIVRGNASEILALAGDKSPTRGVDSTVEVTAAIESAHTLAERYGCTVCVSGAVDVITNGVSMLSVSGGSPMMTRVTGLGCTASALIGAFAGVCAKEDRFSATVSAMGVMSCAGSLAALQARGPGSFLIEFLDALHGMTEEDLAMSISILQQ